ncbi:MAG: DUF2236 domain-containing protein [Bacteroidetes bacterium]|nr:MAG: DUF2236 domain-containing protein [Bacteroidota bacterium]
MLIYILVAVLIILLIYVGWYHNLKSKARPKAKEASNAKVRDWSESILEEHRKFTDPIADDIVKFIFDNKEEKEMEHIFRMIVRNDGKLPDDLPPKVKEYFEKTEHLPDWADWDLIKFGQENYIRHGLPIAMLLFYKSLPECYTGAKGAQVLLSTTRLNDHSKNLEVFSRRMSETGLFIFDAMMPGGLNPGGKGIRTAQKVRLIHASMRYFLKKRGWDTEKFDDPINQEDMAGTLMSFSSLILLGLEQIGIKLDTTEREAYIHCWRVIGHVMGVHPDLIPNNADDAISLGMAIINHQKAPSKAGHRLANALLNFCDKKAPPFIKEDFHTAMMRLLMGEDLSAMLEIPPVSEKRIKSLSRKVHTYTKIREWLDHSTLFALIIKWIDTFALKFSFRYLGRSRVNYFFLPKSLTRD